MTRILIIIAFLFATPARAGDLQRGHEAAIAGDFKGAVNHWQPLAAEGNAEAQYLLASYIRLVRAFLKIIPSQ